jgi:CheY-like chemotaxis protein
MSDACKVLITSRGITSTLVAGRGELTGEILTFDESEPLRALEAITTRQPDVVALDAQFASTPRGMAFLERIRTDPVLAKTELLIVLADGQTIEVHENGARAQRPPAQALDQQGTRRVPRVAIQPGVEILIDGKEADLIDLSLGGAQVLSATVVRPNKPVRVVMPDEDALLKVNGVIVWSRFELPPGRSLPHYRAGIAFSDPDPETVIRYSIRRRK